LISGIAFDPASTASSLILWVSHSQSTLENATDWTGKVSRLSGANLDGYRDVVVGLPRSIRDHVTNQPTFGPDGALYLNQGSMSAMGAPDNAWGDRSEHLLSGAILRVDTKAITGTLNVKTESGGTYNPFASGARVTIYAEGVRNSYDGVWHRNGHYFVTANGSAAGGSTPAGGGAEALHEVDETQADFLFDIEKGGYYGHPNPKLGNYVLNGGNPTSGADENEVTSYDVGTDPDPNYKGAAYTFGKNYSANGIIEYKGNAFSNTLDGKLMVVRYSGGDDIVILTPDKNGNIVATEKGVSGLSGFEDPLDLIEDPKTGFIYVAEHGGEKVTLLKPAPQFSFNKEQLVFSDIKGGNGSASQNVTFTNTSGKTLTIPSDGINLTGGNAGQFVITSKPSGSRTLSPGQSVTIGVQFMASSTTSFGIKVAALSIRTTSGTPPLEIALRGLALEGSGGASEPSLQKVLDLFRIGATVGDSNVEDSSLQNPPTTPNDEVNGQRFFKAGSGNVTIEPITFFSPTSTPTVRAGWYRSGDPGSKAELFTVPSQYAQSVAPVADGATSFDPGSASFGLYTEWPSQSGRRVYSEHALNTWESNASLRQKVRVYPLKTAEGVVVPNAYVVGFEEIPGTISDYQDGVFIIRNVALEQPAAVVPRITHVKLVDADTGVITSSLNNGMTINLANTPHVSVQALVTETTGSVRFQVDGKTFRIENTAPFMINGDDNGSGLPIPWVPSIGTHELRITPYTGAGASGTMGPTRVITIHVTDGAQPGATMFREFINFQPDGTPVPDGYRADIGRAYGVRKNGLTYGWSEPNEANVYDRDDPDAVDQRFDTFAELGDRTWSIKVPNGTYSVYVNATDPSNINAKYGIMVQDVRAVWGVPTEAEPWAAGTVTVDVTDGILRVTRAVGSRNNKLAFIQISQLS
jgi:glucose/arabinose dehydrogenase